MMYKTNLILFFVLIFNILFACSCARTKKVNKIEFNEETSTPIKNRDSLKTDTNSDIRKANQVSKKNKPKIKKTNQTISKQNKYYLIIGCFKNKENAKNIEKELIQKGLDPKIIRKKTNNENDIYLVSYMNFNNKTEAEKQLAQDRQEPEKEKAWLYIK